MVRDYDQFRTELFGPSATSYTSAQPLYAPKPTFNQRVQSVFAGLALVAVAAWIGTLLVRTALEPVDHYTDNYVAIYGSTPTTDMLLHISWYEMVAVVVLAAIWGLLRRQNTVR